MKKGFTLIEILITALILSIAVSGTLMTFVYCQRWIIEDMDKQNALSIINSRFEEIQRLPSQEALIYIGPAMNNPETITMNNSGVATRDYHLTYEVIGSVFPEPGFENYMLNATITWADVTGSKNLEAQILTNDTQ